MKIVKKHNKNSRNFMLYVLSVTIIYFSVCFSINICLNKYIQEIGPILIRGFILYLLSLISYIWYNSTIRRRIFLKRKIKSINKTIEKAIKLLQVYVSSHTKNNEKYDHIKKTINKMLSKKKIRETFQPVFEEDTRVLKIITLFNKLSENKVGLEYNHFKNLFKKQNGIQPLPNIDNNIATTTDTCISTTKDYLVLLEGTLKNNISEIEAIDKSKICENTGLFKKYEVFSEVKRKRRLYVVLYMGIVILLLLIGKNIFLMNNDYIKASKLQDIKNYEKSIEMFKRLGWYRNSKELELECTYEYAASLWEVEKHWESILKYEQLGEYKNSAELAKKYSYACANSHYNNGEYSMALFYYNHAWGYKDSAVKALNLTKKFHGLFSVDGERVVIVKNNGTVFVESPNGDERRKCKNWRNIVAVRLDYYNLIEHEFAPDNYYIVGLTKNGDILTTDEKHFGLNPIMSDVVDFDAGGNSIVGLQENGRVLSETKYNSYSTMLREWRNVISVYAENDDVSAITNDGKILTSEETRYADDERTNSENIKDWDDLIAINNTYGLKAINKDSDVVVLEFSSVEDENELLNDPEICCKLDGGYFLDKYGNILDHDKKPVKFGVKKLELTKEMVEGKIYSITELSNMKK